MKVWHAAIILPHEATRNWRLNVLFFFLGIRCQHLRIASFVHCIICFWLYQTALLMLQNSFHILCAVSL